MSTSMILDLSSLNQALLSLKEAITEYKKNTGNLLVRDASLHRFKYTYEIAHKILKRYLELSEPNSEEIDQMSFPSLMRTASERGLIIHGWDAWKQYREARNMTSHTHNQEKAIQVCDIIPAFLEEAKYLHTMLEQRQHITP